VFDALSALAYALALAAISYQLAALLATVAWQRRQRLRKISHRETHKTQPAATILKPLSGIEPRFYENLSSFCRQDYPDFQIVFGVQDAGDPALAVVERLRHDFPACDIGVIVDARAHGTNAKVNNLINMFAAATHELIVIADSDIAVGPDYLAAVLAPLKNPHVGIVTCPYRGRPESGFWSRLGALYINDWFFPSVLLAHALGSRDFGFGASIALRRDILETIGGFAALADRLADDYWLGKLTRGRGLATVLSGCEVTTLVHEPRFVDLWRHEVRWLSTVRTLRPLGYGLSFVTHVLPVAVLAVALGGGRLGLWILLGLSLIARLVLHYKVNRLQWIDVRPRPWLVPLRDFLTFFAWCAGLGARRLHWRRQKLHVKTNGSVRKGSGDSV
jgi:ceramide glucosyltransferase